MHVINCVASDSLYPSQYHRISSFLHIVGNAYAGLVYKQYYSFDIFTCAVKILERWLLAILDSLQHTQLHPCASSAASYFCVLRILSLELACHCSQHRTSDPVKEERRLPPSSAQLSIPFAVPLTPRSPCLGAHVDFDVQRPCPDIAQASPVSSTHVLGCCAPPV